MNGDSVQVLAATLVGISAIFVVSAVLIPPLRRLRQPQVIAEILAGIALGPSLLGLLPGDLTGHLFPQEIRQGLSAIAQVGIVLFMFLVGWETNLRQVRARGGTVLSISLSSFALPFGAGVALAVWLSQEHTAATHNGGLPAFALFVGAALAVTAFPVLARIVVEHRLHRTPVGTLSLASAAVCDVLAWCALAVVSAVAAWSGSAPLWELLGYTALFATVLATLVRPLVGVLVRRLGARRTASPQLLALLVAGTFIAAYVAERIGLDAIFGAFAFGLVMPRDSAERLESSVRTPLRHVTALLVPVFFVSVGLTVDVTGLGGSGVVELLVVIAVACVGKIGGATAAAKLSGMSWRDSASIGILMNTRGLTELIILNAGMNLGVLDTRMFTVLVLMALVTTAMAGPLLPRGLPRQSQRYRVPTPAIP